MPEVTSSPPPAPAAATADGQRVFDRVRHLADDIGLRQAGTPREQQAVDYIADQLRGFGYNVSIQDFSISNEAGRTASLTVHTATDRKLDAVPLSQSASAKVRGAIAAGGKGLPADLSDVSGKVALIERLSAIGTLDRPLFEDVRGVRKILDLIGRGELPRRIGADGA